MVGVSLGDTAQPGIKAPRAAGQRPTAPWAGAFATKHPLATTHQT